MLFRKLHVLAAIALGVLVCDCGSSGSSNSADTITISNFLYSPSNLSVKPGTTITVVNQDSTAHTLTSQSALGDFTKGAVSGVEFDTGSFTGTTTFTIPSTAPVGTVIPYFCTIHKSTMGMGQGQITIVAQ